LYVLWIRKYGEELTIFVESLLLISLYNQQVYID
jgi:hypothetical protein